ATTDQPAPPQAPRTTRATAETTADPQAPTTRPNVETTAEPPAPRTTRPNAETTAEQPEGHAAAAPGITIVPREIQTLIEAAIPAGPATSESTAAAAEPARLTELPPGNLAFALRLERRVAPAQVQAIQPKPRTVFPEPAPAESVDAAPAQPTVEPASPMSRRLADPRASAVVVMPEPKPRAIAATAPVSHSTPAAPQPSATHADAAPPQSTPREAIDPRLDPPAASQPVRQISLVVDNERIGLRVAQRGDELHVAVRTPDAQLTEQLRRHVDQLVASLDQAGFRSEVRQPADDQPAGRDSHPRHNFYDPARDQRRRPNPALEWQEEWRKKIA
ncbi:MAG: hypothetical protein ACRD96_09135, partial [Bryobacteraceae bacterium]